MPAASTKNNVDEATATVEERVYVPLELRVDATRTAVMDEGQGKV
jgi:hypothetical protein